MNLKHYDIKGLENILNILREEADRLGPCPESRELYRFAYEELKERDCILAMKYLEEI